MSYDELYEKFEKMCVEEGVPNVFPYMSLADMEKMNFLLDRLMLFCQENEEELEELYFSEYVFELGNLAETLFDRDLFAKQNTKSTLKL